MDWEFEIPLVIAHTPILSMLMVHVISAKMVHVTKSLDQNLITINYKFNNNFKSHFNLI
jgi:hypothetical protein